MLLGEPSRTQYDLNFALFGIPVRVHPLFWLVACCSAMPNGGDGSAILTWIAAVFFSILIHELGHAMVIRIRRIYPWIMLYSMGGLASCDPASTRRWTMRTTHWRQILICAAGPVAGFLLAAWWLPRFYASGSRRGN